MRKKKIAKTLSLVLLVLFAMGIGVYAGANYGSKTDPLITLSYLEEVFTQELLSQVKADTGASAKDLADKLNKIIATSSPAAQPYKVVTLTQGQVLQGSVGCEILLRIGTANCKASESPGLVDATSGGTIDNGAALTKNHLYMVTIDGGGFTATAATVKAVVRGVYTIK